MREPKRWLEKRRRRDESDTLLRERMAEAEGMGMESQSTRAAAISMDGIPVDGISNDWMADPGEVRPQLVGASGDGSQPHPCGSIEETQNPPEGGGGTTGGMEAVAGRMSKQSCQRTVDGSSPIDMTVNIREIKLVHLTTGEQRAAAPQRLQSTRQKKNTGGVTVKPVHQTK